MFKKRNSNICEEKVEKLNFLSINCGHMDFSFGYTFSLKNTDGQWLFNAECFIHNHSVQVKFEETPVSSEDVSEMFEILKRHNVVDYIKKYKKPPKSPFHILDETIYGISIGFINKKMYGAKPEAYMRSELEKFFYGLAEKLYSGGECC